MKRLGYQSSVYCHCFGEETNIDLFGTFEESNGRCPICGSMYTSKQVPISEGQTRNEITVSRGLKGKTGKFLSEALYFLEALK